MAEKKAKVIYDRKKTITIEYEEGEAVTTTTESINGTLPNCLDKNDFSKLSGVGKRKCSCGKHTMYWLVALKGIWPNGPEMIRVIEK